jgi:hypothetical protein
MTAAAARCLVALRRHGGGLLPAADGLLTAKLAAEVLI